MGGDNDGGPAFGGAGYVVVAACVQCGVGNSVETTSTAEGGGQRKTLHTGTGTLMPPHCTHPLFFCLLTHPFASLIYITIIIIPHSPPPPPPSHCIACIACIALQTRRTETVTARNVGKAITAWAVYHRLQQGMRRQQKGGQQQQPLWMAMAAGVQRLPRL